MTRSGNRPGAAPLRALRGGKRGETTIAGVHVVVAPLDDPPFAVQALVEEEDTWLALSDHSTIIRDPGHPVRVMTAAWEARPEPLGSVFVRPGNPLRLLAVVHDLDAETTCRQASVDKALENIWLAAEQRRLASIALPVLGSEHGRFTTAAFVESLRTILLAGGEPSDEPRMPRRLWLVRGRQVSTAEILAGLGA